MKNKIIIGVAIAVVVVGVVAVFLGKSQLQKGALSKSSSLPDLTIHDISTAFLASYLGTDDNKIKWVVAIGNKGACFKDSKDVSKKVKVQLWGIDAVGTSINAKPSVGDFNDYSGYLGQDSICGNNLGLVLFTFDNSDPFVKMYATINSSKGGVLESNKNNNSRTETGHMKWVEN